MKKPKPYAELVTQAEEATRAIKDPELRRVAFERVLDDLLSGGGTATQGDAHAAKPVERSTRTAAKPRKSSGPKGYVRELIDDGFFKKPKTIAEVKAELANRGHHPARQIPRGGHILFQFEQCFAGAGEIGFHLLGMLDCLIDLVKVVADSGSPVAQIFQVAVLKAD